MALTADVSIEVRQGKIAALPFATSTTIYNGAFVALATAGASSGRVVNITDAANREPLGFTISSTVPPTGVTAPTEIQVNIGGGVVERLSVTGASATTNGSLVYATDENTFTLTATSNTPAVGVQVRHHTGTTVDVDFFPFHEMRNN